ncbi:unnamed protein product [Sphagnum jensenii]|uniref:Uncharacterized protein n=1 Tax=Sphagnum jensenii TaxID=128206 RepID=A0ABP1A6P7_9BRYO
MQDRATEAIACRPGSQSCIAAKPVASQACLLPSSKERVQKAKGRKDGKKAGVISVGLAGMMTRQPLNTQGRHLIIISPPANFLQPSYSGLPPPTAYLPASYRGSLFGLLYEGQKRRELPATKKDNPIR